MLPSKAVTLVQVVTVCLCAVIAGVDSKREGGGGKRRRKQRQEDEPLPTEEPEVNMCDIQNPEVIYCYCDVLDYNQAEEGNCWIFNNTTMNAAVWEGFVSQTSIKRLTLHLRPDGTLETIPTVSINHLPELQMFEVQYATIDDIQPYSFGNSSSLEKISLSRNSIKSLGRNAFANMPAVNEVSLSENHITEVNRHVFVNLPKLTKLFMDRNNITTLHDKAFQGLHNLVELELFSNQIMAITPDTFKGLQALERLDLRKNRIEVVGDMTFQDLGMLKVLDLQENSLKYIAPKSFLGLKKMRTLNLQDNKLLALGSEIFSHSPSIHHLDVRANVLETINKATIQPIMDNLESDTMQFYLEGNNFRCDTRLSWMFSLLNETKSVSVRQNLEAVICYLEAGTLPPRLEGQDVVTPLYETTTLGIGPMTKLFNLHLGELPEPMLRGEVDCDEEATSASPHDSHQRKNRRKKRPEKDAIKTHKPQNDMAPELQDYSKQGTMLEESRMSPIQETRGDSDSGAAVFHTTSTLFIICIALTFMLQHC
ncbi:unnamed protein product, partial [Meganyctiphanes norvegica]